jgi:hypothetical protein
MPALTALVRLPQAMASLTTIVGMAPGQGGTPVRGVRETTPHGHTAALPEPQGWGVLAAGDVTSGSLEATPTEGQRLIGVREEGLRDVVKPVGGQGDGELLKVGYHASALGMWTGAWQIVPNGHERRWRRLAAYAGFDEVCTVGQPAAKAHARRACLWDQRPYRPQAQPPVQQGRWRPGHAPVHRSRQHRPLLIPLQSWRLEGLAPIVSPHRPTGQALVRHPLGCVAGRWRRLPRNRSHPPGRLVQLLLAMAVRLTHGWRHILPIRLVAHLRRPGWPLMMHGSAEGCLRSAEPAPDWHAQPQHFCPPWRQSCRRAGQPCLRHEHAA